MSKKLLSLLLVLVMLVGCFAGCGLFGGGNAGQLPGGNGDDNNDDNNTPPACEHEYTNACDTTCNKCNEARTIQHTYANDCDTTCNVCNAERTVAPCADNDGDDRCDSCGANLACDHAWDNDCDSVCNKCEDVREAPHNYAGACDDTCNDCGTTRSAAEHNDTANGGFIDAICDVCGFKLPITLYTPKVAQYNTTTQVMPSNWNELNYSDNNDTQIMSYIGSSFFTYDYKFLNDKKFNADGSINKAGVVDGAFTTNYSAATAIEDVTSSVDAKWGYTAEQKAEGGYAWKITFRNDLKWDDGTPITAADFEYSMQQQLDPKFMNFRANLYYDTLMIKNSRGYFFQDQAGTYESLESQGYKSIADAIANGVVVYFNAWEFYGAKGYPAEDGTTCPEWLAYNDEKVYTGVYNGAPDPVSGAMLYRDYADSYLDVGKSANSCTAVFVENKIRYVAWDDVGMYTVEGENAIVICLDKTYSFLTEEGDLSLWAAYYMSSLPLVKRDLYESCKQAPAAGATLWTTNYNSSLATTASWGPFKLVEFEAGSHYKLVKNDNWYGWSLPTNQNQYNISGIYCVKIEEATTQWMGFLSGKYDDSALDTFNVEDYLDSKYVTFSQSSTGTYGMQLYSDLTELKKGNNNNGILAIQEFRHAFNLAIDRSNVIESIWPGTATPCFGLLNVAYYYDIEGAATRPDGGKYRNSTQAMEGVLRAYGYTQATDGTWSINDSTGLSLDAAYEMLTGFNMTLAKEKMAAAIAELTANAEYYGYDSSKDITLIYGASVDNDKQQFRAGYLQGILNELTVGTALEGKIKVILDASAGSQWAEAFRSGKTQIGFGYGFTGNAFNPFDIIGAFVNPNDDLNYHMYWDTSKIDLTLTMPAGDYEGAGETITMSVLNWFFCLNGLAEVEKQVKTYNWGEGFAPVEARLLILSALEEIVLKESRSVMLIGDSGGSFLGAKFDNFSDSDNIFMGFGGLQYMEVVYTDAEWDAYVQSMSGDLSSEYMKSE